MPIHSDKKILCPGRARYSFVAFDGQNLYIHSVFFYFMPIQIDNINGERVIDPYNSQGRFNKYFEQRLAGFSKADKPVMRRYIEDMNCGKNVSSSRGKRGYYRLNTLMSRLTMLSKQFLSRYNKNLTELNSNDLIEFFELMRKGDIQKANGAGRYKSVDDYIKVYKAFWHWHMKTCRHKGVELDDITIDLYTNSNHKPDFVYFTLESLRRMMDQAKFEYKVLMLFLFDSGIRVTEMVNIKRKDISKVPGSDKLFLNIRNETSKTFGRKFKLMLSSNLLTQYLTLKQFSSDDFIFPVSPKIVNLYLKRLCNKVFGENLVLLEENYGQKKRVTIYDFRHSSCCYWLPRYKSESALKWRFGWKKSEMIYYYSEFLGMKDTIQEDDMLVDVTKTDIEKALEQEKQKTEMLQERMNAQEKDLGEFRKILKALAQEKKQSF